MQVVAFSLIFIGVIALVGWASAQFFTSPEVALWLRIVVGCIGLGFFILLAKVILDRLRQSRDEDFKGVDK